MTEQPLNRRVLGQVIAVAAGVVVVVLVIVVVFSRSDNSDGTPATHNSDASSSSSSPTPTRSGMIRFDATDAYTMMTKFTEAVGSYSWTSKEDTWARTVRPYVSAESSASELVHLPTGKTWATCRASHCTVTTSARVVRTTNLGFDPPDGSTVVVTSLVHTTTTTTSHDDSDKDSGYYLLSAQRESGDRWRVTDQVPSTPDGIGQG